MGVFSLICGLSIKLLSIDNKNTPFLCDLCVNIAIIAHFWAIIARNSCFSWIWNAISWCTYVKNLLKIQHFEQKMLFFPQILPILGNICWISLEIDVQCTSLHRQFWAENALFWRYLAYFGQYLPKIGLFRSISGKIKCNFTTYVRQENALFAPIWAYFSPFWAKIGLFRSIYAQNSENKMQFGDVRTSEKCWILLI